MFMHPLTAFTEKEKLHILALAGDFGTVQAQEAGARAGVVHITCTIINNTRRRCMDMRCVSNLLCGAIYVLIKPLAFFEDSYQMTLSCEQHFKQFPHTNMYTPSELRERGLFLK